MNPHTLQPPLSATNSPSPAPFISGMDGAESNPAPQPPLTADPSPSNNINNNNNNNNNSSSSKNPRASKRAKRDSRRKREAREDTADDASVVAAPPPAPRRRKGAASAALVIPCMRLGLYPPIPPKESYPDDTLPPRARQLSWVARRTSETLGRSWDFYEVVEKLSNKNGYRYTSAIDDPTKHFPRIRYRSAEAPPYQARLSFEDSTVEMLFTEDGLGATTNGPWHSARANVCAREGTYYYEARIISGVIPGSEQPAVNSRGHVRLGFSRREAELDVNVGHDCYGYGIRDVNGEVVNRMRCKHFMPKKESICEGDVIGMLITLPPLSLHRKVVEGTYDPAVDGDGSSSGSSNGNDDDPAPVNLIRDRVPFHDKKTGDLLWQQSWINPSKQLRDYAFNLKDTPSAAGTPSPRNSDDPSLRTLPGSKITIYKNGVRMGTAFEDLFAFLPPASRSAPVDGNNERHERENADDGMIGYFPTVSCFRGGAVECRFQGPWWYGPPVDDFPEKIQFFGDRFNEHIADDIVADIVDEVEAEMQGWSLTELMAANTEEAAAAAAGAPASEEDTSQRHLPVIQEVVSNGGCGAAGEDMTGTVGIPSTTAIPESVRTVEIDMADGNVAAGSSHSGRGSIAAGTATHEQW
ncbi:hypothetical protein KEM54_003392 [Ascosphaera aggregata]|nr:hypothetical protein KEM54_003392 [Ascosphaera aggregata]